MCVPCAPPPCTMIDRIRIALLRRESCTARTSAPARSCRTASACARRRPRSRPDRRASARLIRDCDCGSTPLVMTAGAPVRARRLRPTPHPVEDRLQRVAIVLLHHHHRPVAADTAIGEADVLDGAAGAAQRGDDAGIGRGRRETLPRSRSRSAREQLGELLRRQALKRLRGSCSTATIPFTSAGRSCAVTQANTAPSPCVTRMAGPMSSSSMRAARPPDVLRDRRCCPSAGRATRPPGQSRDRRRRRRRATACDPVPQRRQSGARRASKVGACASYSPWTNG